MCTHTDNLYSTGHYLLSASIAKVNHESVRLDKGSHLNYTKKTKKQQPQIQTN